MDLNKKLGILGEYATVNGLEVNIEKTKVMLLHRDRGCRTKRPFMLKGKKLETINFVYLGVLFTSSALFCQASQYFVSKAISAVGSVIGVIARSTWLGNACITL